MNPRLLRKQKSSRTRLKLVAFVTVGPMLASAISSGNFSSNRYVAGGDERGAAPLELRDLTRTRKQMIKPRGQHVDCLPVIQERRRVRTWAAFRNLEGLFGYRTARRAFRLQSRGFAAPTKRHAFRLLPAGGSFELWSGEAK
jgi:hypothetical protein